MGKKHYLLVCGGNACESNQGGALLESLRREVAAAGLDGRVQVVRTGCLGFCEKGPVVKVLPEETLYINLKPEDAAEIVSRHLVAGQPVARLLYDRSQSHKQVRIEGMDFYQKQFRIVLRNCGVIDPEKIDEYIARDGYAALEKALFDLTPGDIIRELDLSGLRGRGGAGFPTARKWQFSAGTEADQKYIVCNADEGDPGAYMDRGTLEGDPHSIIEAMIIAGYTVGANKGFLYVRAEYPLAITRLQKAIGQATDYGLLGRDILGTGFDFDLEIRLGAGAFVCGEETALLTSIEGNRGMPVPRPPFPAVKGLWGKPTVINNVETLANIPVIVLKGGEWFSRIGTENSRGTKVFALTGKINNSGLIEVPMGITLREIIFDIGGGIRDGKRFKAAQTGGPSGGVITDEFLDLPIDYENLAGIGSIMGSGGLIVMDENDCMVDVAKFYLDFTVDESCGKCAPCRIGGRTLYNMLDRITQGQGEESHMDQLRELGSAMRKASLCGLGQTAPNPVLSALRFFEDEYKAHILDRRCPAGKCKSLLRYLINDKCVGCTACARACPVSCIDGAPKKKHVIDQDACVKCGRCQEVCRFEAVEKA